MRGDFGFDGGMFASPWGRWAKPISEGKVDGDNVSFAVVREFDGNQFRINYKGKVSGDEMKLTGEMAGMDRTFEMTAKRAK